MELVPILSTIILVGTIATFILAVFAYILYKIREGKSRERAQQRPYAETRHQPAYLAQQPGIGDRNAIGQRAPASMYIAPTSTVTPQHAAAERDEMNEPAMSYAMPSPAYAPSNAPRLAPPQYESMTAQPTGRTPLVTPTPVAAPPKRTAQPAQPGSLFWEYTDEDFIPVDPQKTAEQQRQAEMRRQRQDNDDSTAWL